MALRVGVDVGGTFTDLVAVDGSGAVTTVKVPSTPGRQADGVMAAVTALEAPAGTIARIAHGTTVVTNLLLERTGARVVLCATDGATDVLDLRRQERAALYDLARHHPPPLVPREARVAVRERMGPSGVVAPLCDAADAAEAVARLAPDIVAVALLHAPEHPEHERAMAVALRARLPDVDVVCSHDVLPEIREYERTATTVAEAYARPAVSRYLAALAEALRTAGHPAPLVVTSSGGTLPVEDARHRAAALALSGPAGGVAGAAAVARAAGEGQVLTVDIGGTSADVGVIVDGVPLHEAGGDVAGVPIALPRVLVDTVSAGGGSIAWVDDGGALRVGPRSAGASPGPACFGRGGEQPTVTDAHVVLGRVRPRPMAGGVTVDAALAEAALTPLAHRLGAPVARVAEAIVATADAAMARALRRVSVERGLDPRACTLLPFGGGGPLHACGLAEHLGMRRILVPPHAGVLSALGLALAPERRDGLVSAVRRAEECDAAALAARADAAARAAGGPGDHARTWIVRARYVGQGHTMDVPYARGEDGAAVADRFAALHGDRIGFRLDRPVEFVSLRCTATGPAHAVAFARRGPSTWDAAAAMDDGGSCAAVVAGPATVALPDATLWVAAGWTARALPMGGWLVEAA